MAREDRPNISPWDTSGPVLLVLLILTLAIVIPSLAITYASFRRAKPPVELKKAFNLLRVILVLWTAAMFILTISWAVYIGDDTAYRRKIIVAGAAPQINNIAGLLIHLAEALLVPLLIEVGLAHFAIGLPDRTPGRKSKVLRTGSLVIAGLLAVIGVVNYGIAVALTIDPVRTIQGPRNIVVTIYNIIALIVALVVLVLAITVTKRVRSASIVKAPKLLFVVASCFYLLQALYTFLIDMGLWMISIRGSRHWISVLDLVLGFGSIMVCLYLVYRLGNPSRWRRVESVEEAKGQEAK